MMQTAVLDIQVADALGILTLANPPHNVLSVDLLRQIADAVAANGPLAVLSVRATLVRGLFDEVAATLDHELARQGVLRETADYAEGVAAVSERRPGRFTGC